MTSVCGADVSGAPFAPRFVDLFEEIKVTFAESDGATGPVVRVRFGDRPFGDPLTDNAWEEDGYRYHDVFHFGFAAWLNWSPCVRKLLRAKRKYDCRIDEVEDGARAAITEEAVSLILFDHAKRNRWFESQTRVDRGVISMVRDLTSIYEVRGKTEIDWERAILGGYAAFRSLRKNRGGTLAVSFKDPSMLVTV